MPNLNFGFPLPSGAGSAGRGIRTSGPGAEPARHRRRPCPLQEACQLVQYLLLHASRVNLPSTGLQDNSVRLEVNNKRHVYEDTS